MRTRRTLIATILGTLAFALVVASAASLGGIPSSSLGADDASFSSCDTNGVTTSYTTAYTTDAPAGYKVGDVTVGGIADACDGQNMSVTLTGAGNASLAEVTQAVPSAAGVFTGVLDFSGDDVPAESVTGVSVVITG